MQPRKYLTFNVLLTAVQSQGRQGASTGCSSLTTDELGSLTESQRRWKSEEHHKWNPTTKSHRSLAVEPPSLYTVDPVDRAKMIPSVKKFGQSEAIHRTMHSNIAFTEEQGVQFKHVDPAAPGRLWSLVAVNDW